ncbi:EAL domain-containing protein [Actinokineospora pegani]|uniref:EAL domain-containing protein n=1 Tax=Actinokineospora pegani TaxID=2654637 RepID=UPI0012EA9C9B|nr:EAL domain-containing protein [Actinokineospora pegani]
MPSPPRADLAVRWAAALAEVIYLPRPRETVEAELAAHLGELDRHARADDPAPAAAVGRALVESGFAIPDCLRASLVVLAPGADSWSPVLGWFASGFAEACKERVFDEQQLVRDAMLRARADDARDLAASEARFDAVFAASAAGMVLSDLDGTVLRVNEALETMLEHRPGAVSGRVADLFHPDDRGYLLSRYAELAGGAFPSIDEETRFQSADGEPVWVRIAVTPLLDRDGLPSRLATTVVNITHQRLLEYRVSYQDSHDPLTRLLNRGAFGGRLEHALESGAEVTVLHLALDDLAAVNDGVGREAGDHLLHATALRLTDLFDGSGAVLARVAGDEFAVLLPHTPDVGGVIVKINAVLAEAVWVEGIGIAASASVAVARLPAAGTQPEDLLAATHIELRSLTTQGRRQWGLVDPAASRDRRAHLRLAASLPGAWEEGQLRVDGEPVLSVPSGEQSAVRARLRWDHPTLGLIDEDRCRALIAETGQGVPLGHWVLTQAAARATPGGPRPYVELTAEQAADPDLIAAVRSALDLCPTLELGIPVAAVCERDSPAEDNLGVLLELDVHTVLTGFGRARGDLACLEDLPVHAVALDPAVIARVDAAAPDSLFTRTIRDLLPLVRATGTSILAGGITTHPRLTWWTDAGVDRAHGPVFAHPAP